MEHQSVNAIVVNDDITQLKILTVLLQKDGINVHGYESAGAALTSMKQEKPPDLIVTDLYMPGIDGWRFCRLLRSDQYAAFNKVPILVVSATFAGDEASRITADLGANAFLSSSVEGRKYLELAKSLLAGEQPKNQLSVLIVEDSKTLAGLLKKAFERQGYRAGIALSLGSAIHAFEHESYDIAVIDYHLPDGKGDTLLNRFKHIRPDSVCIMMTTDPNPELALAWMNQGAAAYLHKPFKPEYLIEQCVRTRREQAMLRVEDRLEERTQELHKNSEALKKKSEQQRLLLDTIDTQIWYLTDIATYGRLNRAHANFLGLDIKKIAHKPLEYFLSKDVAQTCMASNMEVFKTRRTVNTQEWIPNAAGKKRLISITKTPEIDENGDVTFVVCAGTDITEQKQAEDELRKSEAKYRRLAENSPAVIFQFRMAPDGTYSFPYVSRVILDVTGINAEQVMKDASVLLDKIHPEDQAWFAKGVLKSAKDLRPWHGILRLLTNGNEKWIEGYSTPELQQDHSFLWDGFMFDITKRVMLQHKLQQMEKNESLSRMAGAIAHLFNNQLTTVIGNLDLLQDDLPEDLPLETDLLENLGEALQAANRAAEISRLMLTFLGHNRGNPVLLDLAQACLICLDKFKTAIRTNTNDAIDIISNLPDPGPVIYADPSQVDQIIEVLLINAFESMENMGEIQVKVHVINVDDLAKTNRFPVEWEPILNIYACLDISDNGRGMTPETINRIFDPFYTDKFTGRGLGLAVALGTIKSFGGCVTVKSNPGKGSVFQVFWPLASENQK